MYYKTRSRFLSKIHHFFRQIDVTEVLISRNFSRSQICRRSPLLHGANVAGEVLVLYGADVADEALLFYGANLADEVLLYTESMLVTKSSIDCQNHKLFWVQIDSISRAKREKSKFRAFKHVKMADLLKTSDQQTSISRKI